MKVENVSLFFRPAPTVTALRDIQTFNEADYPDLHYIAREGQHVVNYRASDGRREGLSYPMSDVWKVRTVL